MRNKQPNCCAEPPGALSDYSSLSYVYLAKTQAAAESTAQNAVTWWDTPQVKHTMKKS